MKRPEIVNNSILAEVCVDLEEILDDELTGWVGNFDRMKPINSFSRVIHREQLVILNILRLSRFSVGEDVENFLGE